MGMIDMTEGEADYLKYRFKQWLGSVARAIQNKRLEEQVEMTKEEIIDGLEIYTVGRMNKTKVDITVEELQKFVDAIKALEQESVLDKVRAEIIELRSRQNVGVLECLDIIDKYKTEIEPQESEDKE